MHEVVGDDCFYIKVVTRDTEALGLLLREKIRTIHNVSDTRTTVVLRTFKQGTRVPIDVDLTKARGKSK